MSYRSRNKKRSHTSWLKWTLWILVGVIVLLAAINAAMWLAYRERVLPNVSLGSLNLANVSYSDIEQRVQDGQLLPETIALSTPLKTQNVQVGGFGLSVNIPASIENLKAQRTWLPLIKVLQPSTVGVELTVERSTYDAAVSEFRKELHSPALPERANFADSQFVIAAPREGYEAKSELSGDLLSAIANGQQNLNVKTDILPPPAGKADVAAIVQKLQKQIETSITFIFGQHKKEVPLAEKGGWYVQDGQTMRPAKQKIQEYVSGLAGQLNTTAVNAGDLALATVSALQKARNSQFVASSESSPKLTYCTNVSGVDESKLSDFTNRTAAILADVRGWNAGGKIAFIHQENCDFTIWLTAPADMPSFGAICDEYYSCRVNDNVVINYDRWVGGTDPWNAAGKSIADYEALVINHEVGHRLGFGHLACTGPGKPAPVMMQQSVDLAGCTFNPWPVESELKTFKGTMDVAALPAREELLAHGSCCCASCASVNS